MNTTPAPNLSPADWHHAGTMWHYRDNLGRDHVGHVQAINDFGGTDISYTFRDCTSGGELNVIRGERLGHAAPIDRPCEIRDRIIREMSKTEREG